LEKSAASNLFNQGELKIIIVPFCRKLYEN